MYFLKNYNSNNLSATLRFLWVYSGYIFQVDDDDHISDIRL
jgi:hypothetical protein